jgi:hypothetical protein
LFPWGEGGRSPPESKQWGTAMSVRTFLTIISIFGLLFGIGDLLVPDRVGAIYGMEASRSAELMARFFGVALLAWALISWFAKDFHDESDLRHILAPSGFAHSAGAVVAAMGTMSGDMNAMGWTAVAIFLFGAVGSFYFLTAGLHQEMVHT